MVPSFVDLLKTVFEKNDIKGRTSFDADSDFGIQKEAWKAILAEPVDSNGNTSLSHFGLRPMFREAIKNITSTKTNSVRSAAFLPRQ